MLGPKWAEAVPVVHLLAFAMPFMTLQVLFSPACDARGKPSVGMKNGAFGAVVLAVSFLVGVRWGTTGIRGSVDRRLSGLSRRQRMAVAAGDRGAGARCRRCDRPASVRRGRDGADRDDLDRALPPLAPLPRLALLASIGAASYALWLIAFARDVVRELVEADPLAAGLRRPTRNKFRVVERGRLRDPPAGRSPSRD